MLHVIIHATQAIDKNFQWQFRHEKKREREGRLIFLRAVIQNNSLRNISNFNDINNSIAHYYLIRPSYLNTKFNSHCKIRRRELFRREHITSSRFGIIA